MSKRLHLLCHVSNSEMRIVSLRYVSFPEVFSRIRGLLKKLCLMWEAFLYRLAPFSCGMRFAVRRVPIAVISVSISGFGCCKLPFFFIDWSVWRLLCNPHIFSRSQCAGRCASSCRGAVFDILSLRKGTYGAGEMLTLQDQNHGYDEKEYIGAGRQ